MPNGILQTHLSNAVKFKKGLSLILHPINEYSMPKQKFSEKKSTAEVDRKIVSPMFKVKNQPTLGKYLVYHSLYSLLEEKKPFLQPEEVIQFSKYPRLLSKLIIDMQS